MVNLIQHSNLQHRSSKAVQERRPNKQKQQQLELLKERQRNQEEVRIRIGTSLLGMMSIAFVTPLLMERDVIEETSEWKMLFRDRAITTKRN